MLEGLDQTSGDVGGVLPTVPSRHGEGPDRHRRGGRSLARIIRPVLDGTRSSVLGPVSRAPSYAVEVEASALGTVGGPRTDADGRALDTEGQVIQGLYAAGNFGGAPTKGFYGGAGGTISLGLVFGHLAGREAARAVRHRAAA